MWAPGHRMEGALEDLRALRMVDRASETTLFPPPSALAGMGFCVRFDASTLASLGSFCGIEGDGGSGALVPARRQYTVG